MVCVCVCAPEDTALLSGEKWEWHYPEAFEHAQWSRAVREWERNDEIWDLWVVWIRHRERKQSSRASQKTAVEKWSLWVTKSQRVCVCAKQLHYIKTHSSFCGTAGHCWDRTPASLPILLKLFSCERLPWLVTPGWERERERGSEEDRENVLQPSALDWNGCLFLLPISSVISTCLACSNSICLSFSLAAHTSHSSSIFNI